MACNTHLVSLGFPWVKNLGMLSWVLHFRISLLEIKVLAGAVFSSGALLENINFQPSSSGWKNPSLCIYRIEVPVLLLAIHQKLFSILSTGCQHMAAYLFKASKSSLFNLLRGGLI